MSQIKKILTVPGLGGSGPRHWQTLWEKENPGFGRVEQADWERAVRQDWVDALECAVYDSGPDTLLVAHSLGCLAVAHWAASTQQKIKGALLVAVPDPDGTLIADRILGFSPLPEARLPFPSVVAASTDDPFGSSDFAKAWAVRWGSRFVSLGPLGHVNAESGLGSWPQGYKLLQSLSGPRLARTDVLAVS